MEKFDQIQQLVESVRSLTTALTEERQERLAGQKRQRMLLGGTLAAILVTGWLVWPGTPAQANVSEAVAQLEKLGEKVEMDIHGINQFFKNANLLVTNLNGMLELAQTSMKSEDGVLRDVGVLVTRFKQDSDVLRRSMLAPPLRTQTSLNNPILDDANASPAIMVSSGGTMIKTELNFLNQRIAELTYYIRSTLGRASTYMNWMPTAP